MAPRGWTNLQIHALHHKDATPACRNARWAYVQCDGSEGIMCDCCGIILAVSCCVPGCTHTRGIRKGEGPWSVREWWVCGDHWRAVPRWRKAIVTRARKRARRLGTDDAWRAVQRLHRRLRTLAIEAAVGL